MWLLSSPHANSAIKEIADKGLQLDPVSNNHWQWKDTALTKLIRKARGLGGGSGPCAEAEEAENVATHPKRACAISSVTSRLTKKGSILGFL